MKIQTAATKIISAWEHGGRFGCHGNGAYGLIGWQGNELITLLQAYEAVGHLLQQRPVALAHQLMDHNGDGQNAELNELAEHETMQRVQREQAGKYIERAIKWQWKFYPFATVTGQLICADIGVNSGINNFYVKHSDCHLGDSEQLALQAVMDYRRKALMDYGLWHKYPGLRRRWDFYDGLLGDNAEANLRSIRPSVMVNGVKVELGDAPISTLTP